MNFGKYKNFGPKSLYSSNYNYLHKLEKIIVPESLKNLFTKFKSSIQKVSKDQKVYILPHKVFLRPRSFTSPFNHQLFAFFRFFKWRDEIIVHNS